MDERQKSNRLSPQAIDYVTAAARAVLGMVPFAGSLLVELAGTIIPNQRQDRIVKFAETLERKLSDLEQEIVRTQLTNENFTDLLEEGMRQAARALSDERREYIASLISNSISADDLEHIESRHLLRILGEINDIEIIWLRFFLHTTIEGDQAFRARNAAILRHQSAYVNGPPELYTKQLLQESYKEHLVQLGLLQYRFRTDFKTKMPEFDKSTGEQKVRGYELSPLGRLLLKHIGLVSRPE